MLLPKESMTDVFETEDGFIAITQPEEECPSCQATSVAMVMFSAARARVVAAELIRLADQIDAKSTGPLGFDRWSELESKKCATTA